MAQRTKKLSPSEGTLLPTAVLVGTVFSGKGEGKKFIALPWVRRQIQEKLGFIPYPGTLNIRLNSESTEEKKQLEKASGLSIYPEKGYCTGLLIKAAIKGLECAIILPQVLSYPKDVLEVIAKECLREKLRIKDDSEVGVTLAV